jgi:hypothetical protein
MTARRRLVLAPIGNDPEVGRWLADIAWLRDVFPPQ